MSPTSYQTAPPRVACTGNGTPGAEATSKQDLHVRLSRSDVTRRWPHTNAVVFRRPRRSMPSAPSVPSRMFAGQPRTGPGRLNEWSPPPHGMSTPCRNTRRLSKPPNPDRPYASQKLANLSLEEASPIRVPCSCDLPTMGAMHPQSKSALGRSASPAADKGDGSASAEYPRPSSGSTPYGFSIGERSQQRRCHRHHHGGSEERKSSPDRDRVPSIRRALLHHG